MKTCKDCKFYGSEMENEGKLIGHCFRYPPQMNGTGSQMPPVRPDLQACGEMIANRLFAQFWASRK